MRYRILGPLEVDPVVDHPALRRAKPRALLAILLLHANEVVSTDVLLDALWAGSPPPAAKGALQNYASQLRAALGKDALVTQAPGYLLRIERDEIDLAVFERLVAEARGAKPARRAEVLRSALALWRGPALAEFAYEDWAQAEVTRLEGLRLNALDDRIEADLELGRHGELAPELEALVAEHPLRERFRARLMLALYRSGRQADALAVYRDFRRMLDAELGLEPTEELRGLERAILEQDATLVGEPATAAAEPAPTVRKVVTVLFADVVGHTRLASTVDPETLRKVMRRFFESMRNVVARHGGTPEKFAGDEVMAVFGVPAVHEDDALRAVRAAHDMRAALAALSDELERDHGVRLELRIGLNTGEVVAGDPGEVPLVTGDAVNVGKRLQEAAPPGEIVAGPMTLALVRDAVETEALGPLELRNRPEPLQAYRIFELRADAPGVARRLDAPLVGRRKELRKLDAAFRRARNKSTAVLALVVGDPGIGKSRLARELTASVADEADVLVGRCVSYGEGATYLPLVDVVQQATREVALEELLAGEEDAEAVARAVRALTAPGESALPAGEASWAFGRFVRALARRRPLVLVLDDAHWAEPTLLDLIEQVVARAEDAPLLVLATARRELFERRPQWTDEFVTVALQPLAERDADALIENLAEDELDAKVRARITEAAEGNPLFAEQLFAFVLERGPEALESLPPSVEALLASRLDTLDRVERAIVERAAVAGRDFRRREVLALSPPEEAGTIGSTLDALVLRGFVRRRRTTAAAEDAFAFNHVLIRDVAYAAVPKERRAELHEAFADWLAARPDARDEIVGYHLEQAYRLASALRPPDRRLRSIAEDAGKRLGRAGLHALARGDIPASVNLLTRATDLLVESVALRRDLLIELGLALRFAGELTEAEETLTRAASEAADANDRASELRASLGLSNVRLSTGRATPDEHLELATRAIPVFEAAGDDHSLGRAWRAIGLVRGAWYCRNVEWEEAAERAIHHFRLSTFLPWYPSGSFGDLAAALFYGPRPAREAERRLTRLLEDEPSDLLTEANVLVWVAGLQALQGRFDDARANVARSRLLYEELGHAPLAAANCGTVRGLIETLAGDLASAEDVLRESCLVHERLGDESALATRAAELADVLYAQARYDEASAWSSRSSELAEENDVGAQFSWRSVQGRLLAQAGEAEEALELARDAAARALATDALNQTANVLLSLAEVLRLAGREEQAKAPRDEALELFRRKGNVVSARRGAAALA